MKVPNTPKVDCPVCKKTVIWSEASPYRPFCSERCKLIDFGDWATEAHAIPGEPALQDTPEKDDY